MRDRRACAPGQWLVGETAAYTPSSNSFHAQGLMTSVPAPVRASSKRAHSAILGSAHMTVDGFGTVFLHTRRREMQHENAKHCVVLFRMRRALLGVLLPKTTRAAWEDSASQGCHVSCEQIHAILFRLKPSDGPHL